MKSIKKSLIAVIGFSLAAALFFSCDNPVSSQPGSTGGSGGGTVNDGGSGGSGGTGGAGGSGGEAVSGGGSGGAGGSGGGTGGAESLPASVGTDPFKGHTYTRTYSNSNGTSSTSYEFGTDNILTYSFVKNGTQESGTRWQYTYNANTKELSLSPVQSYGGDFSGVYAWRTRDEIAAMYNNYTYSAYVSQYGQNMTESEFNQEIQQALANNQKFFETVSIYKAEEDFFKNLKLRTKCYKTVPSSLVSSETLYFSKPGNSNTLDLSFYKSGNYKGQIRRYQSNTQTYYMITDITADTIIAKEAISSQNGYTLRVGGQELHINYSNLALGDDSNLVITLTPADAATTSFFTGLFGNTSVTLSTDTSYSTYIWQDATASTAEYTVPAWPSDAGSDTLNHTYTNSSTTYTFTAGGTLTYEYTYNSNQTRGTKWDYKYNATTKELCLRTSHIKISLGNNSTADWHTYSEIYNYYRTRGYSNDETEAKNYKAQFESLTYYLATPEGATLTIRNNYYKTAPTRLPYTTNLNFNKTDTSINKQYYLNVNSEFSNSFGTFQIYPMNQQGSWVPEKSFLISNITENTITAAEATQNNNGTWTPVTGGQQLQLGYTLALGTNNTIAITLTGGDFGTTGVTLNTSYSNMQFTRQQ